MDDSAFVVDAGVGSAVAAAVELIDDDLTENKDVAVVEVVDAAAASAETVAFRGCSE